MPTTMTSSAATAAAMKSAAQIWTAKTFNFTPYVVAGGLFVLLTIPMTRLTDAVSRRYGYPAAGGHL